MIYPFVDDFLLGYDGVCDIVDERPADAAAAACVNEAVLRTGVEGIFPLYEFRMKHYVPLLAL